MKNKLKEIIDFLIKNPIAFGVFILLFLFNNYNPKNHYLNSDIEIVYEKLKPYNSCFAIVFTGVISLIIIFLSKGKVREYFNITDKFEYNFKVIIFLIISNLSIYLTGHKFISDFLFIGNQIYAVNLKTYEFERIKGFPIDDEVHFNGEKEFEKIPISISEAKKIGSNKKITVQFYIGFFGIRYNPKIYLET